MRSRRPRIASCTDGGIESTERAVSELREEGARSRSASTPVSFELWAPVSAASDSANKQTKSDRMMRSGPIMTLELWQKYGGYRNRPYDSAGPNINPKATAMPIASVHPSTQ